METTRIDSLFQRAQALFSGAKACYNRGRVKQTGEEHPMQIMDQFGAAPGAESVRMPDGTERTLAAEHAAAILVNEQPAFRVVCTPELLPPLAPVPQREIPAAWVDALADAMGQGLPLYRATHAVHSCLLLRAGKILYRCEDLGRHNALDKAVGCALTEGVPLAECVLFTSGRVPVDMVRKAIRAGVPALVSKSMPTVQSLELAEEYGLKLFIRQKK